MSTLLPSSMGLLPRMSYPASRSPLLLHPLPLGRSHGQAGAIARPPSAARCRCLRGCRCRRPILPAADDDDAAGLAHCTGSAPAAAAAWSIFRVGASLAPARNKGLALGNANRHCGGSAVASDRLGQCSRTMPNSTPRLGKRLHGVPAAACNRALRARSVFSGALWARDAWVWGTSAPRSEPNQGGSCRLQAEAHAGAARSEPGGLRCARGDASYLTPPLPRREPAVHPRIATLSGTPHIEMLG
eukprot:349686-Chlamydomonas_euryale.AAC.18